MNKLTSILLLCFIFVITGCGDKQENTETAEKKAFDLASVKKQYTDVELVVADISEQSYQKGAALAVTLSTPLNPEYDFQSFFKVSDKDGVFKLLGESIRRIDLEEAKKDQIENGDGVNNSENNKGYYSDGSIVPQGCGTQNVESADAVPQPCGDYGTVDTSMGGAGVISDSVKKQKIEITIPSSDDSKILLQKLSDLLKSVPDGSCEVYLLLNLSDGGFKKIKTSRNVEGGENVLDKIGEVVGKENIKS